MMERCVGFLAMSFLNRKQLMNWLDFYWFLMFNEGISGLPISKLVAIGTGCAAAGICAGLVWIVKRASKG